MQGEKINMMHESSTHGKNETLYQHPLESTLSSPLASNAKKKTKDLTREQKLSCQVPRSGE
jgi:hypothetical protein